MRGCDLGRVLCRHAPHSPSCLAHTHKHSHTHAVLGLVPQAALLAKEAIVSAERMILHTLDFDLEVPGPHRAVKVMMRLIGASASAPPPGSARCVALCWCAQVVALMRAWVCVPDGPPSPASRQEAHHFRVRVPQRQHGDAGVPQVRHRAHRSRVGVLGHVARQVLSAGGTPQLTHVPHFRTLTHPDPFPCSHRLGPCHRWRCETRWA